MKKILIFFSFYSIYFLLVFSNENNSFIIPIRSLNKLVKIKQTKVVPMHNFVETFEH